ncbi:hypothetical protein [Hoeflea poritis]|uniref:DUF4296 domain-containing protein n=1 Tax=Hoeflea poritis TaxID=2993659 RepID=A0ABT4VPK8_9HYPH|nr:hypothetical protein [Hoeflea poritis]MDA4846647.1 hypothetical protein [Hoeflea poritis]
MTDLLTLLGALYACNVAAEQGPLTPDQTLICVRNHDAVKMKFLTAAEIDSLNDLTFSEKYQLSLKGYTRFKTWERENPDVVDRIRKQQVNEIFPGS